MSPFRWLEDYRTEPAQVIVAELNPERVWPVISVQSNWNGSRGLIRGIKEDGRLVEDHIREILDDGGRVVDAGHRIVGGDEIRAQFWTVDRHLKSFLGRHPDDEILAWVGNGNVLSNPHFVAFANGEMYHLKDEDGYLKSRRYTALVVRHQRSTPRVSIESLDLGKPLPGDIKSFTFGQRLVTGGHPIDQEDLVAMACDQQFYDLRHLFLFGRIPMGEQRWIDVGLGAFWENSVMDTGVVAHALRGGMISLDVRQFSGPEVGFALKAKGYAPVDHPSAPGDYSLRNGRLDLIFLEGIYPHNMVGISEDGKLLSVVTRGLSNRVGLTIRGAASLMAQLGARDALLLDNGADVMMWFDGATRLGPGEAERSRLRSMLIFCRRADEPLELTDARLIVYPQLVPRHRRGPFWAHA